MGNEPFERRDFAMKASSMFCLILTLIFSASVFAADAPPMRPKPDAAPPNSVIRAIVVGPADAIGSPKPVTGQLAVIANVPNTISASEVEIFIDEVSIGTSNNKPYKVEYDSTKLTNGIHTVKVAAHDDSGAQLWSASVKIEVTGGSPKMPENPPAAVTPPPTPVTVPDVASKPAQDSLMPKVVYKSDKYGFSIKHPEGWTVRDETISMKSRDKDEFWFVIGEPPIVVNLHCKQLSSNTTAEVFAKYNPYVMSWERRAVANSPAFVTTDGKPELKRVVHRVIFIRDGFAWMANCIDTTGEKPDSTVKLLDTMLESIKFTKPVIRILPVK
jgi:hypothetical protein